MSKIKIEWLSDWSECDTCGPSYAEGARVYIDDALVIVLEAAAHCFDGSTYESEDVFKAILEHLGHTVEFEHPYEED